MTPTRALGATLAAICLAAGLAQAQYVEDSIDVGGAQVYCLAYNSRANVIYGCSQETNYFFAISCDSNKVISRIYRPSPRLIAYDSIDNKAYLTTDGDSVIVVDGRTHAYLKGISMSWPRVPVWDAVTNRLYVSCLTFSEVAVIDCASDSLLVYIPVGRRAAKMYLNVLRRKLYTLNFDDGTVSVIDLASNEVVRTIHVGGHGGPGYYCRRIDKFYCVGSYGDICVIDGRSDSVVARIPVAGMVASMAGNEQANLVMFGTYDTASYVYTVDACTDSVTDSVEVDGIVYDIRYSGETDRLYCASAHDSTIYVISGDGASVLRTVPCGGFPYVLKNVPRYGRIYVGDLARPWVYVIRDSVTGIAEEPAAPALGQREPATFVCGVLRLPEASSPKPQAASWLLDIGGRKVMALRPGANDVSRVPAGVYFVCPASGVLRGASGVTKVILQY